MPVLYKVKRIGGDGDALRSVGAARAAFVCPAQTPYTPTPGLRKVRVHLREPGVLRQ